MANETQGSPEHYKGQYAGMKFAPFKQQEYPKLLYKDDARKAVLGVANNALEEKELYASIGVDKVDIDPLGAALDENAELRIRLAAYEGDKANAPQKAAGVQTNTVEMLSESASADATAKPANPLLKPAAAPAGGPQPVGTAPKMDTKVNPGV